MGTSNTVAGAVNTGGGVIVGIEIGGGTMSAVCVVMITKTRAFGGVWGRGQWCSWWLVVGTGDGGDERIVLLWVLGTVVGSVPRVYVRVVTVSSVSFVRTVSDTEATCTSAESSSGGAMGTVSTTAIQVGVDSGVKLVGNVGVVWAGSGSVRTEAACARVMMSSSAQRGDVAVVRVRSRHGLVSTVGTTSVSVRVYSRVELVGNVRVMGTGVAGSMCAETADSVTAHSIASVSVRVYAGVKFVGNIRVVRTGSGGCVVVVVDVVRSNSKGSTGSSTVGVEDTLRRNSISVRIYSGIQLVGNSRVVGTVVDLRIVGASSAGGMERATSCRAVRGRGAKTASSS